MVYSFWQGTKYCMYFALLFSVAAAVFAVVNTAITPVGDLMGIPGLYLWNIISGEYSYRISCLIFIFPKFEDLK